jgi:hypothetical protein
MLLSQISSNNPLLNSSNKIPLVASSSLQVEVAVEITTRSLMMIQASSERSIPYFC